MTRPPPTSTLFPYTTLFRSIHYPRLLAELAPHLLDDLRSCAAHRLDRERREEVDHHPADQEPDQDLGLLQLKRLDRDRKSTRLNSSHVEISYAVFCLKKKKK